MKLLAAAAGGTACVRARGRMWGVDSVCICVCLNICDRQSEQDSATRIKSNGGKWPENSVNENGFTPVPPAGGQNPAQGN